jgi:hypothetical protein
VWCDEVVDQIDHGQNRDPRGNKHTAIHISSSLVDPNIASHSGGFRSPLSQLSACLMGSSLSHVWHMNGVPAGVV